MSVSGAERADTCAKALETLAPGAVFRDVPLGRISRWRIGGPADLVVRPRSLDELARLRGFFHAEGIAHLVIGATSNLLFADAGLRVACLQIGPEMSGLAIDGADVTAEAGVWVPGLARRAQQHGLSGIVHTCGIPGTLGGLVCMNGGSQRRGIGDVVDTVTSVAPDGRIVTRAAADCGFAYRRSVYQTNGEVIAEVRLTLTPGADRGALRREMLAIMGERRRKFPQKTPNCGSVFVSNPAMYADHGPPGAVIEKLGFKGQSIGAAQVSPLHANFIVNTGGATARDTLALISRIRDTAHRETGYLMEVEARFVAPDGTVRNAHD